MVAHAFNTTELVEMVADHPDEPTVMRWTLPDGLDETSRRAQCVTGNRAHACLQVESRTGPDTEPRAVSVHCRRSSAYSWPGGRPTHRDGWNRLNLGTFGIPTFPGRAAPDGPCDNQTKAAQ